jgi:UDP-GlcNAc3NAcA epimerase
VKSSLTVVGARPQFVKASALSHELAGRTAIYDRILHTGQHYDPDLSDRFFEELELPAPSHHLQVGSGSHGNQTGEMLKRIEQVLLEERPDIVIVYGDTNSTLAGALAAAKLHIPIAHVEAGLRSFNRRMPEEINRVLTDHVSSLLFCPTALAVDQLKAEGIQKGVHQVGDVMYDVARRVASRADSTSKLPERTLPERGFVLATIHRAENTDSPSRLQAILDALARVSETLPVIFPVHPRTRAAIGRGHCHVPAGVSLIEPVGLIDMTWLERHAALIVTDSGGVQKEAYFHRTPCVTVRTETEWPETITAGWNRLANPDSTEAILAAVDATSRTIQRGEIPEYGDGRAAAKVVDIIEAFLQS